MTTSTPAPVAHGIDRAEFDRAVAERDWADMDTRWPIATRYLAFLTDLERDDLVLKPECVAASRAALDLVEEIMSVFDRDNPGQFHSYAVCKDRLAVIEENLHAYLRYDGTVD